MMAHLPANGLQLCAPPSSGSVPAGCGNSISVRAFLDEGDDRSLEEIKNQQDAARSAPPPGSDSLPSEQRTSTPGSRNGLCGPLSGRKRPEAPSREDALLSPISVLTAEIDKLHLQGLGSSFPETPNKSMEPGGETVPVCRVGAVGGDPLGAPEADGLGSQQTRTQGGVSVRTAQVRLQPAGPGHVAPQGQSSVPSGPSAPATRTLAHGLFLSG